MIRTILLAAVMLTIAIGGGAGSVWLALDSDFEFDTVTIGDWTAYPARGTPAADPYSKARFSREADLSLGRSEGLIFIARRDGSGAPLRFDCDYRIEGNLPPARFWTLHARDANGKLVDPDLKRAASLHSLAMLRAPDGTAVTTVSQHASPGNWLAVSGTGTFVLVLTLYDTAIASSARISEVELPTVTRERCDD